MLTSALFGIGAERSAQGQTGERIWSPPHWGTYFSMKNGGTNGAPIPFFPYDPTVVPVYALDSSSCSNEFCRFIFDDRGVEDSDGGSSLLGSDIGGGSEPMDASPSDYPSNALYLSIALTNDPVSSASEALLTLHGAYTNLWQLWSTPDLQVPFPFWTPGQIINDDTGTNEITFDPLPTANSPARFFRAVGGDIIVDIFRVQDAIETNQVGVFEVTASGNLDRDITVIYRISGSAVNGIDYTNLSGRLTIPTAQNCCAEIDVQPLMDNCIDFDESVILTLEITNTSGYLVDPLSASDAITISDNFGTNIFLPVVTNLNQPTGIDYHAPSNSLVVSFNYDPGGGLAPNFLRVYTNVVFTNSVLVTNTVVTNWSGVGFLPDEVKLATVKETIHGFTNGDMYFGSGANIGWLAADGTGSNLTWCTLTNDVVTNALPLRGSLYLDRTGVWSNDLIAVTSDSAYILDDKGVWRVSAQGHPTLVANIQTRHLEGVITLPNDVTNWGPWAGKIITGDEGAVPSPVIYAIDTNGVVTTTATTDLFPGGIRPEDFDIIATNQNVYACDPEAGTILKLSANLLTCARGDLLVTEAGEQAPPAKLFILHWDGTKLTARRILYVRPDTSPGHFEHVTLAPISIPSL